MQERMQEQLLYEDEKEPYHFIIAADLENNMINHPLVNNIQQQSWWKNNIFILEVIVCLTGICAILYGIIYLIIINFNF